MNITKTSHPFCTFAVCRRLSGVLAFTLVTSALAVHAQTIPSPDPSTIVMASVELPNAPGVSTPEVSSSLPNAPLLDASYSPDKQGHTPGMASHTDKYIQPGQPAPSLSVGNKFALGFKDAFSIPSVAGWVVAAGYEQATNGSPNYGSNATAFGKRVGAAAARAASEGVFSDAVMASVLREDPRYYQMGPGHNFIKRFVYAGSRALITKTDSGRTTPNFAQLAGNLGGSYLTKTYYPDVNTTNKEVLSTFGGSIGGSALGFLVSEFFPNINLFNFHKQNN